MPANFAMAVMKRKDKKQTEQIADLTTALAGMVRLFCSEDGCTILAEHVESVEAVCALASIGAVEVLKDGGSWTEAVWK